RCAALQTPEALRRLEQAAHRAAARGDGRGIQARFPAAVRQRKAQAARRPRLPVRQAARGEAVHGVQRPGRQNRHSALIFASFTTLPQVWYSRSMYLPNSSGVMASGSTPVLLSAATTCGLARALPMSRARRLTISFGVFAGAR